MNAENAWLLPSIAMMAIVSGAVAATYLYLWRYLLRRPFIGWWALGWLLLTLRQVANLAPLVGGPQRLCWSLGILLEGLAGLSLLAGCYDFTDRRPPWRLLYAASLLALLWSVIASLAPGELAFSVPSVFLLGICLVYGGVMIRSRRKLRTLPVLLVLSGLHELDAPLAALYYPDSFSHGFILGALLAFSTAACFLVASLKEYMARGTEELKRRVETEEVLRTSEARFVQLAEITQEVVWEIDPEGVYTYLSPGSVGVFGCAPEELVGRAKFYELHPEPVREAFKEAAFKVFAERAVFRNVTNTVVARDGSERVLNSSGTPLFAPDGSFSGYRGVDVDVTERHLARVERNMLFRQLETILEFSRAGIVSIDPEGRIVFANPRMSELFGYSREELLALTYPDLVHPEQRPQSVMRMAAIIAGEVDAVDSERRYARRDGSEWWGFISSRRYADKQGKLILLIAVISDQTEKRRMEEQVRQAMKVESIGRLSGGVAHDFNNMLSIINGHAEMALMLAKPGDPAGEHLEEILQAGRRSANIVRQLLAFARKQDISPVVLDLNEKVADLLKMLGRLIGEDVKLTFSPGEDLWRVKLDPSQVDQLLINLATNARDAITGNGRISLATGNATLDETFCRANQGASPGEYATLSFGDDGCGMSREVLENIFDPFFTTKPLGEGTGLGLATVYGIVRQNGGYLKVESEVGGGSMFTIYLPRCLEEPAPPPPMPRELMSLSGEGTILVVEDEGGLLKFIAKSLTRLGYTVLGTDSPEEAAGLAAAHGGDIDLVITDVIMPGMNGRELSLKILALRPSTVFLFISGYTRDVVATRGFIDGSINFLPKPFTVEDLAAKVAELLRR